MSDGLLTSDDFSQHVGQAFIAGGASPPVELHLLAVTAARNRGADRRAGFSLLFQGPVQPALAQGLQSLRHPVLGEPGIFLVPVGLDAQGMLYEAIFY